MAITFPEQKKSIIRILLILLGAALIFGVVAWYGYSRRTGVGPLGIIISPRQIEVNFAIFRDPIFDQLRIPYEQVPFPSTVGKENPFLRFEEAGEEEVL